MSRRKPPANIAVVGVLASIPTLMMKIRPRAMSPRTTSTTARDVDELLTSPIQVQSALSVPVCTCDGSRAWYMKRQMMPAPMNEIAIGRKINDLAALSALARSASTATASPAAVDADTTTMTHHTLLKMVPRTVERMAQARKKK